MLRKDSPHSDWKPPTIELLLIGFWAFCIPLPAHLGLGSHTRLLISNYRPLIFVSALGLILFVRVFGPQRKARRTTRYSRYTFKLLLLGTMFPVYQLTLQLVRGKYQPELTLFYFIWAVFSFLYASKLAETPRSARYVAASLLVGTVANLIFATWLAIPQGLTYAFFEDRLSMGYSNPTYFSQTVQLTMLASITLLAAGPIRGFHQGRLRLLLMTATISTAAFAYLAKSESTLGFVLVAVIANRFLEFGRKGLFAGGAVGFWFTVLLLTLTLGSMANRNRLDRFSSGRISHWQTLLSHVTVEDKTGLRLLFGSANPPMNLLNPYDSLRDQKNFQMPHRDNVYLTFWIDYGLVGLALFLAPYALLFRKAVLSLESHHQMRPVLAAFIAIAVQCFATSIIPSINNPVGFWVGLFSILPLAIASSWGQPSGVNHDGMVASGSPPQINHRPPWVGR